MLDHHDGSLEDAAEVKEGVDSDVAGGEDGGHIAEHRHCKGARRYNAGMGGCCNALAQRCLGAGVAGVVAEDWLPLAVVG